MQRKIFGGTLILALCTFGLLGCSGGDGSNSPIGPKESRFSLTLSSQISLPSKNLRPDFIVEGELGEQAFTGELFWGNTDASCDNSASLNSLGAFQIAADETEKTVSPTSDLVEGSHKIFAKLSWNTKEQKIASECFGGCGVCC